jgi:hypothetical protein
MLKQKIIEYASEINITGDIDLDGGYSYSYQVSVIFPNHFQAQILKSEFSVYDQGAGDVDDGSVRKRTLSMMARVDTNIFTDISTTKAQVPSEQALAGDIKNMDLKVHRLKSSAYWICYIILQPVEPDWHQKQQAVLGCDLVIDNLLKAGMNFLDVADLATVARINEDNANKHVQLVSKLW